MSTRGINNGTGMMPQTMAGATIAGAATLPTVADVPTVAPPRDSYIPPTEELSKFDRLARLPSKEREQEELSELYRLHGEWIAGGGRTLFEPAFTKLPDLFIMMARGAELVVAGERPVLTSPLWGTADVRNLNGIKGRYLGNVGQSALARDLAIITGRLDINIAKFTNLIVPKETKKGERKAEVRVRRWSMIGIDWRRYLYFAGLGIIEAYWVPWINVAGYDAFSTRYFHGDSPKAWKVASALLSKDDFARLAWGKMKFTNVKEHADIRAALMNGLEDGTYVGEAGYDRFAVDRFQGASQKAWRVAASLLSKDDFARLTWGKQKCTNVKEQAAIRAALMKGLEDGTYVGEAGYDKFATEHFQGASQKAWKVASSLLSDDAFARLEWGKGKLTNVKEQAAIRTALRGGIYKDHEGQIKFAAIYYAGDLRKAYYVARSLLNDADYDALRWRASDALTGAYDEEAFDMLGEDDFDDTSFDLSDDDLPIE